MTALNDLDRFHLVMGSIDRLPQTGDQGIYLKQQRKGKLGSAMAWASKKYRCDLDIKKMSSCALVQRARTDSGIGAGFDQITSWRSLALSNRRRPSPASNSNTVRLRSSKRGPCSGCAECWDLCGP